MSVKEILRMGNPLLRKEAEDFTIEEIKSPETKLLLEDMWDSLEAVSYTHLTLPTTEAV